MAKKAQSKTPDRSKPRRFEFVGGSSQKFWTIVLEDESHTVQYGRLGTLGQTKTKEFDNRDLAEASYQKLVAEKLKKGYEEQFPPTAAELKRKKKKHEPFLKEILADPDDPGPYAVYGDWLAEQGDPRGEFIQVQLQLEDESLSAAERKEIRKREKQLLARHEETWLGSLAPLLLENPIVECGGYSAEQRSNFTYRFERGFLASLRVARLYVPVARVIRDAEQTKFLRELTIENIEHYWDPNSEYAEEESEYAYELGNDVPTWEKDRIQFVSVFPLLGVKEFSCLHSFQVGFIGEDETWTKTPATSRPGDCHCYCNPASDLVEKMPRLRHLDLLCKDFDIHAIFKSRKLNHLKSLRIYHLGNQGADRQERKQYEYPLELLAKNKAFPNLEALAFHPHYEEYHNRYPEHASFLPLEQIKLLLKSKHLKKLSRLQLRLSDMGDEGCQAIVDSGILKQLKWLDLRHGEITDKGARILAECPDLKHLEYLDLARNGLTPEGVRALRRTKIKFQADNQLTPAELDEQEYLHDGDFE